jgi:hypothetical protein
LPALNVENWTYAVVLAQQQNLIEPKMKSKNKHDDDFYLVVSARRDRESDGKYGNI